VAYTPSDGAAPTTAAKPAVQQANDLSPSSLSALTGVFNKFESYGVADGVVDGSEFTAMLGSKEFEALDEDVKLKTKYVYERAGNSEFHTVDEWVAKVAKAKVPAGWQPQTV
jgi:hypothetical protein